MSDFEIENLDDLSSSEPDTSEENTSTHITDDQDNVYTRHKYARFVKSKIVFQTRLLMNKQLNQLIKEQFELKKKKNELKTTKTNLSQICNQISQFIQTIENQNETLQLLFIENIITDNKYHRYILLKILSDYSNQILTLKEKLNVLKTKIDIGTTVVNSIKWYSLFYTYNQGQTNQICNLCKLNIIEGFKMSCSHIFHYDCFFNYYIEHQECVECKHKIII
jgi:hypothetical protein